MNILVIAVCVCACTSMCVLLYWTRHKMATSAIFSPVEDTQLAAWSEGLTPSRRLHRLRDTRGTTAKWLSLSCSLGLLVAFSAGFPTVQIQLSPAVCFSADSDPCCSKMKKKCGWRKREIDGDPSIDRRLPRAVLLIELDCFQKYLMHRFEINAQYSKYEGSSYTGCEHQSLTRSTLRNAPTKPPDRLYRQTQSTAAGFADRRPCWSVLIIETRKECDKEKLRRDKNETAKVRLLLYCQGTKTRGSEKTLWGIIAKSLDKVINMSD